MTKVLKQLVALCGALTLLPAQTGANLPKLNPAQLPKESFTYGIEWKLINAGTAKMTYTPLPRTGELKLRLESSGLVSKFIRVGDEYTSTMGTNLCAQNTFLSTHEGSRNKETRVTYDTRAKKAIYQEKDLVKKTTSNQSVDIPPCAFDVLGGLWILRNLNLEPGKSTTIPVSDGKKMAWAKVDALRREELKTVTGPKKAVVYEIFLFNNVIYRKSGHLHVWLSDDARRVPLQVQIRLQFTVGTVTFKLEKEEKL